MKTQHLFATRTVFTLFEFRQAEGKWGQARVSTSPLRGAKEVLRAVWITKSRAPALFQTVTRYIGMNIFASLYDICSVLRGRASLGILPHSS